MSQNVAGAGISFNSISVSPTGGGSLTGFHNTYIPFGNPTGGLHDTIDTGIGALLWNNGLVAQSTNTGIAGNFIKVGSTAYVATARAQTDITGATAKSLFGAGKGGTDYWLFGLDNTNFILRNALNNETVWNVSSNFGRTGIGMLGSPAPATPTAMIHIAASSGAANNAPLKFTSGTLLTASQAGAMEFNTDDLYFTITTGAARKQVALWNNTAVTGGRVPFTTTAGRLTSDAGFTFGGFGMLTVPGLTCFNAIVGAGASPVTSAGLQLRASGGSEGQMCFAASAVPSAPADGDIWFTGAGLFMRVAGVTRQFTLV